MTFFHSVVTVREIVYRVGTFPFVPNFFFFFSFCAPKVSVLYDGNTNAIPRTVLS